MAQTALPVVLLAFDRSVRSRDAQGFLHVAVSNISKACVNPYLGREIPGCEALGLDPERVYQLYRDPGELAKAAASFNNLPLMAGHIEVNAEDPHQDRIVGSTGTDAQFRAPYLQNSLVIWDKGAIERVESREQVELSCAYRYVAEMVPGVIDGVRFDGRMTEIQGNHVALVEAGRAGPDVVVGDSKQPGPRPDKPQPNQEAHMASKNKKLTPRGHAVKGALVAHLRPKLAQDAALNASGEIVSLLHTLSKPKAKDIAAAVQTTFTSKLAKDAKLDQEALVDLLENLEEEEEEDVAEDEDESDAEDEKKKAADKAAKDKAAKDKAAKDKAAKDKEEEEAKNKEKEEKKPAMDADTIRAQARADFAELRAAEKAVEPIVGEVSTALDSAEAVYRFALDSQGIPNKDVPAAGLKPLWDATVKVLGKASTLASDAAPVPRDASKKFSERFPNAQIPRRA